MVANGQPQMDNTGARMKGQATNGYCPPGRNFPTCGHGSSSEIDSPYDEQAEYLAALEESE